MRSTQTIRPGVAWLCFLFGILVAGCDEVSLVPTSTRQATADPSPPAKVTEEPEEIPVDAHVANLPFSDSFDDPMSGWPTGDASGGSLRYANDAYAILAREPGVAVQGTAGIHFSDVAIDVQTSQVAAGPADNNDYGVGCRVQPDGSGYYLLISGDGLYTSQRLENSEFQALVEWTPSDAIRTGDAENHVQVLCEGAWLTLMVNGVTLASVKDTRFTEGDIGLTATTYEEAPTEIHFDDLQATPLSEPTAASLAPAFSDAFDDPTSGWERGEWEDGSVGIEDGAYVVRATTSGVPMWGVAGQAFDDLTIEVTAEQVAAGPESNNEYGVGCRIQADSSGYYLLISGDGYATIRRVTEEEWVSLIPWTLSSAIIQGNAANRLRVTCRGPRLVLSVNGIQVAEAFDDRFTSGDIALEAASYEQAAAEIHFDELMVTSSDDQASAAESHGPSRPSTPILRDDFEDVNSGWESDEWDAGSVGYAGGVYRVVAHEPATLMWGVAGQQMQDGVIRLVASQVAAGPSDNNGYGVGCRIQADGSGYYLLVSGDGYAAIIRRDGDSFVDLAAWAEAPSVRTGDATNQLQATCDGPQIALSANETPLLAVEDSTYTSGDLALVAVTYEDTATEVHFDNLTVTAPAALEAPLALSSPALSRYIVPAQIEQALFDTLADYDLAGLEIRASVDEVVIAFEQPDDLSIARTELFYLSLLDHALLHAPFVDSVRLIVKLNSEPVIGVQADAATLGRWQRGEIGLETMLGSLDLVVPETPPR